MIEIIGAFGSHVVLRQFGACSQWYYCGGASKCPDCPSLAVSRPFQYSSVLLPSGKKRRIKVKPVSSVQMVLFGGAL